VSFVGCWVWPTHSRATYSTY